MKRVLLTPLDWGLGHATRCIPVIRELERQGCEVLIAGSGDALELLKKEYPDFPFFSLPGYAPNYPLNGSMTIAMARQLPRFIGVISREHRAVERIVKDESIDLIVSDNRYGCWSDKVPSVFITHQSNVLMPKRFGWFQRPVRRLNEKLINRFSVCWIPDFPAGDSMAGALISFGDIRVRAEVHFVGWLSRFGDMPEIAAGSSLDVLAILSGPEPQRTAFENMLVLQLKASGLRFRIVRGLASASNKLPDPRFVNFLTSKDLQAAIDSAAMVISRSGYSTVMDMHALGRKVIFVPTPGQTEQEYLAARLMEKKIAYSITQENFDLSTALAESKKYNGFNRSPKNHLLSEAVRKLLNR